MRGEEALDFKKQTAYGYKTTTIFRCRPRTNDLNNKIYAGHVQTCVRFPWKRKVLFCFITPFDFHAKWAIFARNQAKLDQIEAEF